MAYEIKPVFRRVGLMLAQNKSPKISTLEYPLRDRGHVYEVRKMPTNGHGDFQLFSENKQTFTQPTHYNYPFHCTNASMFSRLNLWSL